MSKIPLKKLLLVLSLYLQPTVYELTNNRISVLNTHLTINLPVLICIYIISYRKCSIMNSSSSLLAAQYNIIKTNISPPLLDIYVHTVSSSSCACVFVFMHIMYTYVYLCECACSVCSVVHNIYDVYIIYTVHTLPFCLCVHKSNKLNGCTYGER